MYPCGIICSTCSIKYASFKLLKLFLQAYFSTLLSRLEFNQDNKWSLRAKVNDGSASLDVKLSNQVTVLKVVASAKHWQGTWHFMARLSALLIVLNVLVFYFGRVRCWRV